MVSSTWQTLIEHCNDLPKISLRGFTRGSAVRTPPAGAGERSSVLGLEDPLCCGATGPTSPNYWASAPEPGRRNCWAHKPQLLSPGVPGPMLRNRRRRHHKRPSPRGRQWSPPAATRDEPTRQRKPSTAEIETSQNLTPLQTDAPERGVYE